MAVNYNTSSKICWLNSPDFSQLLQCQKKHLPSIKAFDSGLYRFTHISQLSVHYFRIFQVFQGSTNICCFHEFYCPVNHCYIIINIFVKRHRQSYTAKTALM